MEQGRRSDPDALFLRGNAPAREDRGISSSECFVLHFRVA